MGKKLIIKGADFSSHPVFAEYTLLDYIEAANTNQYIDSGITLAQGTSFEGEISLYDISQYTANTYMGLAGVRAGNTANTFCVCIRIATEGTKNIRLDNGNGIGKNYLISDNNKHSFFVSSTDFKVDGTSVATSSSEEPTRGSYKIGILNDLNSSGTLGTYTSGLVKIHSFKIKQNGVLKLDAIPVKRNSDNVICLYDKITSTYLTTNDGVNPLYGTL